MFKLLRLRTASENSSLPHFCHELSSHLSSPRRRPSATHLRGLPQDTQEDPSFGLWPD